MLKIFAAALLAGSLATPAFGEDLTKITVAQPVQLTATISTDAATKKQILDLASNSQIQSPNILYKGKWHSFYPVVKHGDSFIYRPKTYFDIKDKTVLIVSAASSNPNYELRSNITVQKEALEATKPSAVNVSAFTSFEKIPGGDRGLAIINRYRAARGLRPIIYDPQFAAVSAKNNYAGGVHRYNTGMQTWASPRDPESAVRMWMTSYYKSHGVIIMSPNITRGGTHSWSTGTTFTGR